MTLYRLIREDQTILEDQFLVWDVFFNTPGTVMEFQNSKGEWKNLHPTDEEAEKLSEDEIIEMGEARGMPVFAWGSALGNGARPHTVSEVIEAACALDLTPHWGVPVRKGDMYLAARNTGAKLLICARVDHRGWVEPVEVEYAFNWSECVKVTTEE